MQKILVFLLLAFSLSFSTEVRKLSQWEADSLKNEGCINFRHNYRTINICEIFGIPDSIILNYFYLSSSKRVEIKSGIVIDVGDCKIFVLADSLNSDIIINRISKSNFTKTEAPYKVRFLSSKDKIGLKTDNPENQSYSDAYIYKKCAITISVTEKYFSSKEILNNSKFLMFEIR